MLYFSKFFKSRRKIPTTFNVKTDRCPVCIGWNFECQLSIFKTVTEGYKQNTRVKLSQPFKVIISVV